MGNGESKNVSPQDSLAVQSLIPRFFDKNPRFPRMEQGAFVKDPEEGRSSGPRGYYFTVPMSLTVMAVSGIASMASETVISPLNILATSAL